MIEKIAFSPKAKKYSLILLIISLVFLIIAFTMPFTLKEKEITILADKSLAVANSVSPILNSAYGKEIEAVRNHPNTNSPEFKKLNNIIIEIAKNNNCSRIFAIYKGVGGKYYNMLESYYPTNDIGSAMNEKYYMNYKSILDKIITEKIYSDYNTKLFENELGKSVIAWSALKDSSGKTVAVLGVQNSVNNLDFNNFSLNAVYLVQLIICLCFILGIFNLYYSFKIFTEHKRINKGSDKKHFKKDKKAKEEAITVVSAEIPQDSEQPDPNIIDTEEKTENESNSDSENI